MTRPATPLRFPRPAVVIPLTLVLAACGAAATDGTPSQQATSDPTASVQARPTMTSTPSAGASADSSCSLPHRLDATIGRAQITDIQVGAHDTYDRIVYTFAAGRPQVSIETATPPLTQDASGEPMRVEGNIFLRIVFHGGTVQLPAGGVSYNGAVSMTPHFAQLRDLQSAGDFEAVSSWFVGLDHQACVRATTLTSPSRLVIDLQH